MICFFLSLQGVVDGENTEPNDRKVSYCSVYILFYHFEQNQMASGIKQSDKSEFQSQKPVTNMV